MKRKGLLVVFTGEGKGKTTAALGMVLRAAGHSMDVGVFQFIKGGWKYGELEALRKLPTVEVFQLGKGFIKKSKDIDEDAALVKEGWRKAKKAIQEGKYDMVVLDEINYAFHYGFLKPEEVLEVLQQRPPLIHVIMTGRYAPVEIVKAADLVTEMKMVKHHYRDQDVRAQKGIEF
ncbi:MAG: cob(I)yrinic acid a,c-diamide adenosyltransferase [Deltaproteobacteria bacterium]|nr:cob(I)yrinic acid a,c-diamide adenosyltransferase [Deltaproteobacteria bacterium]MBW2069532.1 cob(I)yrinic acid a,c-diamide adenosyltransferase [Deltaproteobacteria bacterium]